MLRCIAIDDEPIALTILDRYCNRYGDVALETFTSPRAGLQRVLDIKPDIVFLDIEMNGASGIDIAKRLPPACCLIFTTAYANYAIEGFDLCAVDFLHKPFFYERFVKAMDKAVERLKMRHLLSATETSARQIVLKSDYKNVTVAIDFIMYAESIGNYIRIHQYDGSTVLSKMPLSALIEQLPHDEFLRVHRSFIVARRRISKYTCSEVCLGDALPAIPIGKKYRAAVIEALTAQEPS